MEIGVDFGWALIWGKKRERNLRFELPGFFFLVSVVTGIYRGKLLPWLLSSVAAAEGGGGKTPCWEDPDSNCFVHIVGLVIMLFCVCFAFPSFVAFVLFLALCILSPPRRRKREAYSRVSTLFSRPRGGILLFP